MYLMIHNDPVCSSHWVPMSTRSRPPSPPGWPFTISPSRSPADARLLAALRREDLVGEVTDPALVAALQEVNDQLRAALTTLARRFYGGASRDAVERMTCAVVDLLQGAVRRHLVNGVALPGNVRSQLAAAIRAALPDPPVDPKPSRKECSDVR
jgi:hypothetical protein